MLVCPATCAAGIEPADERLVQAANQRIARRELRNQAGEMLEQRGSMAACWRADRQGMYPIVDGIPILLVDEFIPLDQLPAEKTSPAEATGLA